MSSIDFRQTIQTQTEVLGPLLHAGVATSLAGALKRSHGLQHGKYPHLIPLIMRAEMREYLETNSLADGWDVAGDARKMGQLLLSQPDLGLEMRFLKERRRSHPGGTPVAGSSAARQQAWTNLPLDFLHFPDATSTAGTVQLLLLWDFVDANALDQFTLRVVHTLTPGVYGKEVPCDLILDVNDGGEIFKRLQFTGSPEDDDLFALVDIDIEENDSGS